jgi:hypothetical protein
VNVVSLNDLWKYSGGEWTWVSGSNSIDQSGTYGTQATASSSNVPGGRFHAVVGSMHPEIHGSLEGMLSIQPGQRFTSMTCGSTNPEGI